VVVVSKVVASHGGVGIDDGGGVPCSIKMMMGRREIDLGNKTYMWG